MARLSYSRTKLSNHVFAAPHHEAGYRLHGGFDASGAYICRAPCIAGRRYGRGLMRLSNAAHADRSSQQLMVRESYPSTAQQSFLLHHGLGQTLGI